MRTLVLAMALLLASCTTGTSSAPPATPPTIAPATATTLAATTTTAPAEQPPCLEGDEGFAADGIIGTAGGSSDDARRLDDARLSTFRRPGAESVICERLLLTFSTEAGAPATRIGLTGAVALSDAAVVRISLGSRVAASALADVHFDGPLANRLFVVADAGGSLFVDVHLAEPAEARLTEFVSPARLALDLRPLVAAGLPAPLVAGSAVLVAPRGDAEGYPLRVEGYVRSRAGQVAVELVGADATVQAEVPAADYPWRTFRLDFRDGPRGDVILRIADLETTIRVGG